MLGSFGTFKVTGWVVTGVQAELVVSASRMDATGLDAMHPLSKTTAAAEAAIADMYGALLVVVFALLISIEMI